MNTNEKLMLDFHQFIIENENIRSEKLVDDYYAKHKNDENEKELLKLCLYEKALIARDTKEFKKSNDYFTSILNTNLVTENYEVYLIKLCMCQNFMTLNHKEEALNVVNEYFQSEIKEFDLEFLVCYATLNEKDLMEEPYISIANAKLTELGYQTIFPKRYSELIEVFNLYKNESKELNRIVYVQKEADRAQLIEAFKAKSSFKLLINQAN